MNKVTQKDITAQNVAGRDLIVNQHPVKTPLKKVIEKYTDAALKDTDFKGVIERLQHYMTDVPSKVIGVEAKLAAANRREYLRDAEYLKEQFTKKLVRHQFSEAAQDVFVHMLAIIHTEFINEIKPVLMDAKAENKNKEVDHKIQLLVEKLYADVCDCALSITTTEIQGMLYFLTGNCHIEWS